MDRGSYSPWGHKGSDTIEQLTHREFYLQKDRPWMDNDRRESSIGIGADRFIRGKRKSKSVPVRGKA